MPHKKPMNKNTWLPSEIPSEEGRGPEDGRVGRRFSVRRVGDLLRRLQHAGGERGVFSGLCMAVLLVPASFVRHPSLRNWWKALRAGKCFFSDLLRNHRDIAAQLRCRAARCAVGAPLALALRIDRSGGVGPLLRKTARRLRQPGAWPALRNAFRLSGERMALESDCSYTDAETGMSFPELAPPFVGDAGAVAVHLHLYYADLAGEFRDALNNIPFAFDLYVSVMDEAAREHARREFSRLPLCRRLVAEIVPNRGRDVAPFLVTFGKRLADYTYVAHLHSKKSLHMDGCGDAWRRYLLSALLGGERAVRGIFTLLRAEAGYGLVYPQTFERIPYIAHTWLANRRQGLELLGRMGMGAPDEEFFDMPVGTMFWARVDALRPLLELGLKLEDFPEEHGQLDGTTAHTVERLLGLCCRHQGFRPAVLRVSDNPQRHRWGLDQATEATARFRAALRDDAVRLVLFDIFDTLLLRPFAHPEDVKRLTALRLNDAELREVFTRLRGSAEEEARARAGRDVDLDAVYEVLIRRGGLSPERAGTLRALEEDSEAASVSPNPSMIRWMEDARRAGKRVGLMSDMFLPRPLLECMLRRCGVPEWDVFYLSGEVGARKDSGDLYRHMLEREALEPRQVLMVGDNARSDSQIPGDMGIRTIHVLKPSDCIAGTESLHRLLKRHGGDSLDFSIGRGLLLRAMAPGIFPFSPELPFSLFRDMEFVGYAVLGPVLLGFAAWLARTAGRDGVDRLYFLARDGKIMREIYEGWRESTGEGPASEYLRVSRRAVGVPAITGREDVRAILKAPFIRNSLDMLLEARLGVTLSERDRRYIRKVLLPGSENAGLQVELRSDGGDDLSGVMEYLYPRLLAQAREEKEAILAYFQSVGLMEKQQAAVVDVGYSGSIQTRLQKLLERPLRGYYLITAAGNPGDTGNAMAGFLAEDEPQDGEFLGISFEMERLLSADEGQVIRYARQEDGSVLPVLSPVTEEFRRNNDARRLLKNGALAYVEDAIRIRQRLHPGFIPCVETSRQAYLLLREMKKLPGMIALDDFYCGRGMV